MSLSRQNIIFIVLLVAVVGLALLGYTYFSNNSGSALISTDTSAASASLANARQGILGNIDAIRSIKLDITILSDPAFLRLQQVVRPPFPDPGLGRANPFLPYKSAPATLPAGHK